MFNRSTVTAQSKRLSVAILLLAMMWFFRLRPQKNVTTCSKLTRAKKAFREESLDHIEIIFPFERKNQ